MNEACTDNRFEIIDRAKKDIIESTNIESDPDEMKVIDNFLFRCWQMGWIDKYEKAGDPIKQKSDETKERMMKKRGKQVLQWEDGRVIAFYESLKHAGRITGIAWQNIKNVCDKKYQHAGGYGWSYAKDLLDIVEKGGIE